MATDDGKLKPAAEEEEEASTDDDMLYDLLTFYLPIAVLVLVVLVLIVFSVIGWDKVLAWVFGLVESSESRPLKVAVINLALVTVTVFALPAPAFYMILNGLFFGYLPGFALNYCFMFIAAAISYWIAHTCLKDRVRRFLSKNPVSHDVMRVLDEDQTGKFLVLFRFLFVPGFVKNYSMAVLDISLLKFCLVNVPGELFYTAIFAYIGSVAYKVIGKLRKGDLNGVTSQFSGFEVLMAATSGLVFVLLAAFAWTEYNQRKAQMENSAEREPLVKHSTSPKQSMA